MRRASQRVLIPGSSSSLARHTTAHRTSLSQAKYGAAATRFDSPPIGRCRATTCPSTPTRPIPLSSTLPLRGARERSRSPTATGDWAAPLAARACGATLSRGRTPLGCTDARSHYPPPGAAPLTGTSFSSRASTRASTSGSTASTWATPRTPVSPQSSTSPPFCRLRAVELSTLSSVR